MFLWNTAVFNDTNNNINNNNNNNYNKNISFFANNFEINIYLWNGYITLIRILMKYFQFYSNILELKPH